LNILVTGGCGFIGVNLIRRLMDVGDGHRIRVIDNLTVGKREDLEEIQRSPRLNTPCTIYRSYRAGLRDPVQLGKEIRE